MKMRYEAAAFSRRLDPEVCFGYPVGTGNTVAFGNEPVMMFDAIRQNCIRLAGDYSPRSLGVSSLRLNVVGVAPHAVQ